MRSIKVALAAAAAAIASLFAHHYADFPAPGQLPPPAAFPSPAPSLTPDEQGIVFFPISNATDAQTGMINLAEAKLAMTIESDCFGSFILARDLVMDQNSANSTNGMTNAEVLAKIRSAAGQVPVTVYHQPWYLPSRTMGYRNDGQSLIHLRDTSLDSVCDTASLIAHEAIGHVLGGWEHDYKETAQREFSVPYSINAGFSKCCVDQAALPQPARPVCRSKGRARPIPRPMPHPLHALPHYQRHRTVSRCLDAKGQWIRGCR